jgi:hypothetical protein
VVAGSPEPLSRSRANAKSLASLTGYLIEKVHAVDDIFESSASPR